MIVRKLPDFLEFVKEVQGFVVGKIMRSGLERIGKWKILLFLRLFFNYALRIFSKKILNYRRWTFVTIR